MVANVSLLPRACLITIFKSIPVVLQKLFSQYKTNVDINSEKAEIIEEKDLFGVKLILAKRK